MTSPPSPSSVRAQTARLPITSRDDRVIETGDLVVCDFGGRRRGYSSDVTRTFAVGPPSGEQEEVHGVVHAASEAARGGGAAGHYL